MSFSVHPLTSVIGAEIRGLDISQTLDAQTIADLRRAWLDHAVLVFPGQQLDPDQQRAFVSIWGTIGKRAQALPSLRPRAWEGPDDYADAMRVATIR